jgi:hypothetical protein
MEKWVLRVDFYVPNQMEQIFQKPDITTLVRLYNPNIVGKDDTKITISIQLPRITELANDSLFDNLYNNAIIENTQPIIACILPHLMENTSYNSAMAEYTFGKVIAINFTYVEHKRERHEVYFVTIFGRND